MARVENLKPWKPGQSGNPGGRPKKRLIDEALEQLLEANDSAAAREVAAALLDRARKGDMRAIQLVAERTQGKPTQAIGVAGDAGVASDLAERVRRALEIVEMSDEDLQQRIKELTAQLATSPAAP